MDYRIVWLPDAERRFDATIEYLKQQWSDKEVKSFIDYTNHVIRLIQSNPTMFKKSTRRRIREVLITEHNLLLYRTVGDEIQLITFFDNRQNPRKKYRSI
ncbi:MAG: type II toxin-antitoxin system RelE/ParE family toxin [Sphingobacteriaceae bacterium]|nr:MAG: type II toxin-antitoxin system RelE/ParE family toxin [Sphingobacteriaceae bacterium]